MTRSRFLPSVAALGLVLLFSACSGDDDEEPLEALTPVDRTVQANPDRDVAAVEEKAGAVDPCALLQSAHGGKASGATASGPHACWTPDSSVRVDVYSPLPEAERHRLARVELAGTVGYRATLDDGQCLVHLPISHQHAISFSGLARCRTTTAYAERAARLLLQDDPQSVARPRGLARVAACDLVEATGLVPLPRTGGTNYTVLDQCEAEDSPVDLEVRYDDTVVRDYQTAHDLAGTVARTQQTKHSCYLRLPLAQPDVNVREGHVLNAFVDSSTCAQALSFARKLITAAKEVEPPGRAPADLLYSWDEPDTSAVGACTDIADQATLECSPAEDADVPGDRHDLIEQAEADPNVLCAAAAPVVRDHYGETLVAVTALSDSYGLVGTDARDGSTACVFGSPDHTFEISVMLSTAVSRLSADDEVAGRPSRVRPLDVHLSTATTSYVVARDEPDRPGFVAVDLTAWPEQGTGLYRTTGKQVRPDLTRIKAAEPFVADLVDTLL